MMTVQYYTFTDNGVMPDVFMHQGRYSQITIGEVNANSFGGGTLLLQKTTLNGSVHTIREIPESEFLVMIDKTVRVELPDETEIIVELINAAAPNLYVEHRNQKDDRT